MALSIALQHLNKFHGYPSLSKCILSGYTKKVTTSAIVSTSNLFGRAENSYKVTNKSLILPYIRTLSTPCLSNNSCKILSNDRNIALPNVRNMSAEDHRTLWKVEKAISALLLGLLPACVIYPSTILDNLTTIATMAHIHWGLEAIAQDYARPLIVGKFMSKTALIIVYILTTTTLGGLLLFNYTDIGLGQFIRKIWALNNP